MDRVVVAHTPLPPDQLLFRAMTGTEALSELFEFEVELLSPGSALDMKSVLGKDLTLEIRTLDGAPRYLSGQVTRFSMVGREEAVPRRVIYRAEVRPWLWYLTRTSDCKIFQKKSVLDILDEVFGEYGFAVEKKLGASYRQWEYAVQYQETDFAFVSRLMEHEGIYYYFRHEKGQHTLVLADDMGAHPTLPGYPTISYQGTDRGGDPGREVIDEWQVSEEIRPGAFVVDDFDFKKPRADLLNTRSRSRGTEHGQYEMYEWLGGYSEAGDGEHYARIRLEEAQARAEIDSGRANVRGMAPGYRFTMRNAARQEDNREYLIVAVRYALREGGYASGDTVPAAECRFWFDVQPTSFAYRAPRRTPVPRTNGPQTATVVGPRGEDLWIDRYGRVKVQFRWDRYGQSNEDSSCWVRVSSAWAGANFGAVNHPRVGQEVIVDFIGGCPDRPIIIGRVYNADQMPPLELPARGTVSGFISRTIKGDGELANHFIIDDDPSNEVIKIHAQKDFVSEVEADQTDTVGGNRTTVVDGHESATYKSGEERHIQQGALEVIQGGESRRVSGGALEVVSEGELRVISGGAMEIVSGGQGRVVTGGRDELIVGHQTETVIGPVNELTLGPVTDTTLGPEIDIIVGPSIELTTGPALDFMASDLTEQVGGSHTSTVTGDYKGKAANIDIEAQTNFFVKATNIKLHSTASHLNKYDGSIKTEAGGSATTSATSYIRSQAPMLFSIAYGNSFTYASASETVNLVSANVGGAAVDVKAFRWSNTALNAKTEAKVSMGPIYVDIKVLILLM